MKKETNAFIMVDKRVAQFPKTLKPIDRLVYFTMLDGADYYESKFGRYAPSIDYLMVMSGATRNTVIDSLKRLESHRLIEIQVYEKQLLKPEAIHPPALTVTEQLIVLIV